MPRAIWLARHAHREDFADPRWVTTAARPHDPPLSEAGRLEARALARRLAREPIQHLFASPFLRCVETAAPIAEALDRTIALEEGLSEWLNCDWFPQPPALLPPAALAALWPRVELDYRSHGSARWGEAGEEALARAGRTARALAQAFAGDLVLVGHGASVLGAAAGLVGAPIGPTGTALPREIPWACLIRVIEAGPGWRIDGGPDTSHLG